MAIRNIIHEEDDRLFKTSRPVEVFDERLHCLLDDMAETMRGAEGVGLAAVQVGVLRRAVVIDCGDGLIELVNPRIVGQSGKQSGPEGCLSFPGEYFVVERPNSVVVEAQDRFGRPFRVKGEGLKARAFCHEIDHLDGVVFKSKATAPYEGE